MTKPTYHVANISGGKDSGCVYLILMEYARTHGIDFHPVMADTGNEHPTTIEYVQNLHKLTGGPEVRIVKADFTDDIARKRRYISSPKAMKTSYIKDKTGKKKYFRGWKNKRRRIALENLHPTGIPFLDLCMMKGRFPSRRTQFCTQELKVFPIMEQIVIPLLDAGHRVLSWQGIRAEESPIRAKQPILENRGGGYWIYRPIKYFTTEEVFALHRKYELEPNPLYFQGMGRVGCFPCINCGKMERYEIGRRYPEFIESRAIWERLVNDCSKRGVSTFFPSPLNEKNLSKDIRDHVARGSIHAQLDWAKTTYGGKQFDLLKFNEKIPLCSSAYGLCE